MLFVLPPIIFTPAQRFQFVRNVAAATSVKITDSPGCTGPKAVKDCDPATLLSSSKLQPVMSTGVPPTFVNSTYSPALPVPFPLYIYSVMRITPGDVVPFTLKSSILKFDPV